MKELDLDKPADVSSCLGRERSLVLPVSRGPYSQVTSQSLSLRQKSASWDYNRSEGYNKPVECLRRDGLEVVLCLDPCPPGRILEPCRVAAKAIPVGNDMLPGRPNVLLLPIMRQVVDMTSGLCPNCSVVYSTTGGITVGLGRLRI